MIQINHLRCAFNDYIDLLVHEHEKSYLIGPDLQISGVGQFMLDNTTQAQILRYMR